MRDCRTKRVYVVAENNDGCWRVKTTHGNPSCFPTQLEAEDYAIALALRTIPSVIRVQCQDGTIRREIRYW